MPPTSPLPLKNSVTVKVAYEPGEARLWTGRGIVIDLFRFSNTVCALLKSGRKDIRVYSSPGHAAAVKALEKGADLFSEIEFPPEVDKYDNSPHTALYGSDASRPALIVTNSGSPAVMALGCAPEILIGCFANMPYLAEYCCKLPMDTLLVPACLYYDRTHVEDFICARSLADAIEGRDSFEAAVEEIHSSSRALDFMAYRPETGKKDLKLILKKGNMAVLPRIQMQDVFGKVEDAISEKT
ncbi:MAG: 2-phosphosulfolactate phosphatase [Elusimicrobia bacterium]|nr:2-phosphosulfolactate phosphatase [Elusimicrobiota bacterium]